MSNKAYNYDFVMYMEGVKIPFISAMITATPNGVEANINLLSNKEVYQIKPKTAVHLFYKDWVDVETKNDKRGAGKGWRVFFSGYLSGYYKVDKSIEGRGLGIVCRDFRMDIRRAPAALAWQEAYTLSNQDMYQQSGIYDSIIDRGEQKNIGRLKNNSKTKQTAIRTYGNSGLDDLGYMIKMIANTAYGKNSNIKDKKDNKGGKEAQSQKNGQNAYEKAFNEAVSDEKKRAKGGFFLDAVVRGMWSEAVGGTAVGTFINKRTRIDKRFMIPRNKSGYNFWFKNHFGLEVGSTIMGNSMFSSLEAAIMRIAGLFSVRVYSCSTPSLIPVNSDASYWVIDDQVKNHLVLDQSEYFGAPYILNETMLLPPMEFTAPPNSNLIFPPMYDKIEWQYDIDSDITRAYFEQIDTLSTPGSGPSLSSQNIQIPTSLFNRKSREGSQKDIYKRIKPALTLEERYKGVNIHHGSLELILAQDDAASSFKDVFFSVRASEKIDNQIADLKRRASDAKNNNNKQDYATYNNSINELSKIKLSVKERVAKNRAELKKLKSESKFSDQTKAALNRHALIKFLNSKYSGRVANIEMQFNPYIMCGFPCAVIASDDQYGGESMKTIIGTVQIVKHTIAISPGGADARTSVVLNNSRYIDEPTDMDNDGNPVYSKATDKESAEIDKTFDYVNSGYSVGEAKPRFTRNLNNDYYDLDEQLPDNNKQNSEYKYAKDFLTISRSKRGHGETNRIYLDEEYSPNRIAKFYHEVFGFSDKSKHFMIGSYVKKDPVTSESKNVDFMYDTIHEAIDTLKNERRRDLLNDYEACVKFIARDVCSADAYFQGILGASILTNQNEDNTFDNSNPESYKSFSKNFDHTRIKNRYHGVTNKLWDSGKIDGLKSKNSPGANPSSSFGLMTGPGSLSSIREHMPVTAFIKERRDSVEAYAKSLENRIQGIQYANRN